MCVWAYLPAFPPDEMISYRYVIRQQWEGAVGVSLFFIQQQQLRREQLS